MTNTYFTLPSPITNGLSASDWESSVAAPPVCPRQMANIAECFVIQYQHNETKIPRGVEPQYAVIDKLKPHIMIASSTSSYDLIIFLETTYGLPVYHRKPTSVKKLTWNAWQRREERKKYF